jgi:hypothetical protein
MKFLNMNERKNHSLFLSKTQSLMILTLISLDPSTYYIIIYLRIKKSVITYNDITNATTILRTINCGYFA